MRYWMIVTQLMCMLISLGTTSVAEALSFSVRDRATGLSSISVETNDEFSVELVIDTEELIPSMSQIIFGVD